MNIFGLILLICSLVMNLSYAQLTTATDPEATFKCDFSHLVKHAYSTAQVYHLLVSTVQAEIDELADLESHVAEDASFRDYLSNRKSAISRALSESTQKLSQEITPSKEMLETNARLTGQLCALDKMMYLLNIHDTEKSSGN